jgi:hypothetical protein
MINHDGMPRRPRVFEVDPSWYHFYWQQQPQRTPRKSAPPLFRLFMWAAVFCAGAYFVQ